MYVKAETALILSDFGGFHKMIMTKYQKKPPDCHISVTNFRALAKSGAA